MTWKRGSAKHSVKDAFASIICMQNSALPTKPISSTDQHEICMNDYGATSLDVPKLVKIGRLGGGSFPYDRNIRTCPFLNYCTQCNNTSFSSMSTDLTDQPICPLSGSNEAV
jgi:hypothetical protein